MHELSHNNDKQKLNGSFFKILFRESYICVPSPVLLMGVTSAVTDAWQHIRRKISFDTFVLDRAFAVTDATLLFTRSAAELALSPICRQYTTMIFLAIAFAVWAKDGSLPVTFFARGHNGTFHCDFVFPVRFNYKCSSFRGSFSTR